MKNIEDKKSVTVSVWIPLLRAVLTALLVALSVVTGYGLWNTFSVWRLFWFVSSTGALIVWIAIFANASDRVVDRRVFAKTTRVDIVASNPEGVYQSGRFIDLPISEEKIRGVASQFILTESFSMATMAGAGKPLSRTEYEILRDKFITRGLAYWVNDNYHNQGVSLTLAGRALMRRIETSGETHTHAHAQAKLEA